MMTSRDTFSSFIYCNPLKWDLTNSYAAMDKISTDIACHVVPVWYQEFLAFTAGGGLMFIWLMLKSL